MPHVSLRWAALLLLAVAVGGCKVNHEPAIRLRAQQLIAAMCADDLEACIRLTDPVFVRAQGTEGVKIRFKLLNAVIKWGKVTPENVRIDQVSMGDDGKSARVQLSIQALGQWKSLEPLRWVLADGQWYLAF